MKKIMIIAKRNSTTQGHSDAKYANHTHPGVCLWYSQNNPSSSFSLSTIWRFQVHHYHPHPFSPHLHDVAKNVFIEFRIDGVGRVVLASRTIRPGEVVLEEQALVCLSGWCLQWWWWWWWFSFSTIQGGRSIPLLGSSVRGLPKPLDWRTPLWELWVASLQQLWTGCRICQKAFFVIWKLVYSPSPSFLRLSPSSWHNFIKIPPKWLSCHTGPSSSGMLVAIAVSSKPETCLCPPVADKQRGE